MSLNKSFLDKIGEGRQYRNIDVTQWALRTENGDSEKIVEGYATTFNTPYVLFSDNELIIREQIAPTAFDGCDMEDVIMQYDHEGRVFARIGNNTLRVQPDEKGLFVIAYMGGTSLGRELFEEIQGGYTTKMSFGFKVGEDEREITENREDNTTTVMRTITKISKLYDVSAVSIPANDATSISARSYFDGLIEELKRERLAREQRERQKQKIKILCGM